MNRHALEVVQFPQALEVVARHASSALGAGAVRALAPADVLPLVSEELRRVDQLAAFLLRAADWHLGPIPDLRAAFKRLGIEGTVLDPAALRDAGTLLRTSRLRVR